MANKVFYINLDSRFDRNSHMIDLFKTNNITNYERIPAFDGRHIDIKSLNHFVTPQGIQDALYEKKVYVPLTKGAIGCALSHYTAYQKIIEYNLNNALILEDDVSFQNDFLNKLNIILKQINNDFDILYLGYSNKINPKSLKNELFIKLNKVYGLFGYIVSNKGARKLLNIFPISQQLDTEISKNFNKLNYYVINPNYKLIFSDLSSKHSKFGTDIQHREYFAKHNDIIFIMFVIIICIIIILYKLTIKD